jgi:uncharacterized protein
MGNRSFLSLGTAAQLLDGSAQQFAEANNNFPTLWQLLLAHSETAQASTDQRVFGDAGTLTLRAKATDGIARITQLWTVMQHHPLVARVPHLDHMLDALLAHFSKCATSLRDESDTPLYFSADLDELSWLSDGEPDDFMFEMAAQCTATWERVQAALEQRDYAELDDALELTGDANGNWTWISWSASFGLGGIDHPYFSHAHEPRDVPCAAWVETAQPDADNWLGHDMERFGVGGRFGVRELSYSDADEPERPPARVLVPAEWDAVLIASHPTQRVVRVQRAERWGLLRIDADGATLIAACELDELREFEVVPDGVRAAAMRGDAIGLLSGDGTWIAAPEQINPAVEELWSFVGEWVAARAATGVGVLTSRGQWCVLPTFASIDEINPLGTAIASTVNGEACIVDLRTGMLCTPFVDAVTWLDWPGVYEVTVNGLRGWHTASGQLMFEPAWDALETLIQFPLRVRAERGGRSGVIDAQGQIRIPVDYDEFTPRQNEVASNLGVHGHALITTQQKRVGLLSPDGAELIPLRYHAVQSLVSEMTTEPARGSVESLAMPLPLLRVSMRVGRRVRLGMWDLRAQREIVPCEHEHLFAVELYKEGGAITWGFLTAQRPGGKKSDAPAMVGVLRIDGSVLHPQQFAWIADNFDPASVLGATLTGRALCRAWSKNEPVRAPLSNENQYVWLFRDGTVGSDVEVLTQRYRNGDCAAAYDLSVQFRDGLGCEQDDALAERWLLLAAGQPERVLDAPAPSRLRQLFGARSRPDIFPADANPQGHVQAALDLYFQWVNEDRNEEERAAARAWIEFSYAHAGCDSRDVIAALGFLLLEGIGGAPNLEQAAMHMKRAAQMNSPNALFNLGVMYESGNGVPLDLRAAMRAYQKAAESNADGAYEAIETLQQRDEWKALHHEG